MVIWYIFRRFGMLHQEKSGNPAQKKLFFLLAGADSRRNSSSAHKAFDSQIFFLVKIPAQRISFQGGEQVAVEEERLHRGQLLQRRCRNLSAATRKYKRFKLMRPIPE
jgi:Ni/Co efflux regulator RcnB